MAIKWPLANGDWSNAANWNGGTKPILGDVVHADGKNIVVNESIAPSQLRTDARSGGTSGGSFATSGRVRIVSDVFAGTTICLAANVGAIFNGDSHGGISSGKHGVVINQGAIQNGDSHGGGEYAYGTQVSLGGIHYGTSNGGDSTGSYGTYVAAGGIKIGDTIATGLGIGTRVVDGGIAVIPNAKGTASTLGLYASGDYQIVIVGNDFGNGVSINGNTDTTYDNIPFLKPSETNSRKAMLIGNRLAQRGAILT